MAYGRLIRFVSEADGETYYYGLADESLQRADRRHRLWIRSYQVQLELATLC